MKQRTIHTRSLYSIKPPLAPPNPYPRPSIPPPPAPAPARTGADIETDTGEPTPLPIRSQRVSLSLPPLLFRFHLPPFTPFPFIQSPRPFARPAPPPAPRSTATPSHPCRRHFSHLAVSTPDCLPRPRLTALLPLFLLRTLRASRSRDEG
jgi:hypothetical protein